LANRIYNTKKNLTLSAAEGVRSISLICVSPKPKLPLSSNSWRRSWGEQLAAGKKDVDQQLVEQLAAGKKDVDQQLVEQLAAGKKDVDRQLAAIRRSHTYTKGQNM
jgi:hypothetical protein